MWCFIVVWTKYWINSTYKAVKWGKILSKSKSEEIKIVSIKITGNNSKMIKYFIYRTFISKRFEWMQTCCSGSCSWQFWLFWLFYGKCIQERRTRWEWKTSVLEIWYLEVLLLPLLSQSAWQFWLMQLSESSVPMGQNYVVLVSNMWCCIKKME